MDIEDFRSQQERQSLKEIRFNGFRILPYKKYPTNFKTKKIMKTKRLGRRQFGYGKPKTEAERKATHKRLTGNTKLPPRGTGRGKGRRV